MCGVLATQKKPKASTGNAGDAFGRITVEVSTNQTEDNPAGEHEVESSKKKYL